MSLITQWILYRGNEAFHRDIDEARNYELDPRWKEPISISLNGAKAVKFRPSCPKASDGESLYRSLLWLGRELKKKNRTLTLATYLDDLILDTD